MAEKDAVEAGALDAVAWVAQLQAVPSAIASAHNAKKKQRINAV